MLQRKKPWKRISDKRLAGLAAERELKDKDHAFFQDIWEERNGRCEITGEPLGLEPLATMFHHILAKAKYPEYRYAKWNIIMIKPDLHAAAENDLDKVPEVKRRYLQLLERHHSGAIW